MGSSGRQLQRAEPVLRGLQWRAAKGCGGGGGNDCTAERRKDLDARGLYGGNHHRAGKKEVGPDLLYLEFGSILNAHIHSHFSMSGLGREQCVFVGILLFEMKKQ